VLGCVLGCVEGCDDGSTEFKAFKAIDSGTDS
jgi:hypothetical protein